MYESIEKALAIAILTALLAPIVSLSFSDSEDGTRRAASELKRKHEQVVLVR